jgi:RNA polymerase sigma-70 factor, ECF subfamily
MEWASGPFPSLPGNINEAGWSRAATQIGQVRAWGNDLAARDENRTTALDRFLADHERRAYRMAFVATGNHDDALDVVQDAMCKLVQRYAKAAESEWPALFTRIVQNKLADFYRRNAVRRKWRQWFGRHHEDDNGEDPLEQIPQGGTHQPDERLGQERAMQSLDAALNALPLRQQQVFLLRQWEGLDVAETAHAMGISEGSVKTHYSRAVQSLRNQLEDHW